MGMMQNVGTAAAKTGDGVVAALIAGLELEFGRSAGAALAKRFLAAEETEFLWDARVAERWLGAYESGDDEEFELDRIAICGRLDGRWFAGVLLVDGEGMPHGTLGKRFCRTRKAAQAAMAGAH